MHKGKGVFMSGLAAVLLLTVSCLTAMADDISYTYDDLGRLTTMAQTDGSTILTMGHTFDETGNVARIATASSIADADHDQMPDGWEIAHGLNPNDPGDALLDSDGDGLSNLAEYQAGTNPNLADTDGDGIPDGEEIAAGTDPLDPASHPNLTQDGDIPFMSDLAMALLMLLLIGQGVRKMPGGPSRWLFPVLFLLALPLAASPVFAEDAEPAGPGWFMQDAEPVSSEEAEAYFSSLPEEKAKDTQLRGNIIPMAATTASPEIIELARALRHDPKLIYDYVHNNIDYVPYSGSLKGATLTLLDGSGNDFDQASLMIALLRQSGFTAQYIYGRMIIPDADSANWLGVDVNPTAIGNVIANGGIPRTVQTGARYKIDRVWVKATIDGVDYLFDPAFKTYSSTSKIDLAAAMGYDQTDFLAEANTGATVGADYIQNMNESRINSKLAAYATNLAATVRSQHPNKTVEEIVGGRGINQTTLTQYSTTLPFSTSITSTWDEIPTNQTATIRIQHAGIDYTANTQDLSGKRLTITYAGTNNHAELRLDGAILFSSSTATTIGSRNNCTVTVRHPYVAQSNKYMDDDQYGQPPVYPLESGRSYAIVYNFGGVSDTLLPKLQQQLAAYKAQGLSDSSESVLGETLNIMGMTWLKEVAQSTKLLSTISETIPVMHHNVGVMAQEAGYFIDVRAGATAISSRHNIVEDKTAHFKNFALIGSAFEHGMLEQLIGSDKPGVSTMKL
ncbi:MAG: transglutaminase domain-containing protein, partial [Chlorobium sp.]|nr:transglutaminase domain-containing protein [Chlorobium sp.]